MSAGTRTTRWTRWPDERDGPLWVAVHLHARAGVRRLVGLELYTERPAEARGPFSDEDWGDETDLLPYAPEGLRSTDLKLLSLPTLLERLGLPDGALTPASRRYGADHWRRVAQVIQGAPDRRTALAVSRAFDVPRRTAKSWIARCRAEGLLG